MVAQKQLAPVGTVIDQQTKVASAATRSLDPTTLDLAAEDVRRVLGALNEQGQTLTTKLNILFVTNGALLTSISISRLMAIPSRFSLIFNVLAVVGFLGRFLESGGTRPNSCDFRYTCLGAFCSNSNSYLGPSPTSL